MATPTVELGNYTFKFGVSDYDTPVTVSADDGSTVRSLELDYRSYEYEFVLIESYGSIFLYFPEVYRLDYEPFRKFRLNFIVGTTDYDGDDYDERDVKYTQVDIDVFAVAFEGDPMIDFVENLATKTTESESVVIHGRNLTTGLSVKLYNGETEYVVPPDSIEFDIDENGEGTATFTVFPGMLAMDPNGIEPCGEYELYFSYGNQNYGSTGLNLIRYKYDSSTEEMQAYSTEVFTNESMCYTTGSMSLVYDSVDERGNAVSNPQADPRTGETIFVRRPSQSFYERNHYVYHKNIDNLSGFVTLSNDEDDSLQVVKDGVLYNIDDKEATVDLTTGFPVWLDNQDAYMTNGLWFVTAGDWVRNVCEAYIYTMVRVKYNKNLTHKAGQLKLTGIQLYEGDIVWLSNQLIEAENGLWVVQTGNWVGYNPYTYGEYIIAECPDNCHEETVPFPVNEFVLVDLGAKASYPVDYVCRDDVSYKCGTRTVCGHKVEPGKVVALLNQKNSEDGIYLVKCGEWEKLGDVVESDISGTNINMTHNIVVQNDIDFCQCGGVFHIDYFYLTPTCYLHHLQRTVKILCSGASIAPNTAENQFILTEYQIRTGEEDSLIGNRGRTVGDPSKEDCTRPNEDFEVEFGLTLVEQRQYVKEPDCIISPACAGICDIPRLYNLRTTKEYTSSGDKNGFTIKFWRKEKDGWHLYAYIGSGTPMTGMDYYVYHLHVQGVAVENLVDVNEHDWFKVTTGVIASGDGADSFGLCDDRWEFVSTDSEGERVTTHTLDSTTLYQQWRITCTTNLLAHCYDYERELRTTCEDMNDAVKNIAAVGDMCEECEGTGIYQGSECPVCGGSGKCPEGYLQGMPHLFAVAYYTTAMTKSQFVAEYNKYYNNGDNCIITELVELIATDDDTQYTDPTWSGSMPIGTDDGEAIRR